MVPVPEFRKIQNCGTNMCTYQVTRKAKYKIILPELPENEYILAPNIYCISSILKDHNRIFSVDDCHNYFSSTRTPRNSNRSRLNGAQIIKL